MIEYYIFNSDGNLVFTTGALEGHEGDIAGRNLVAVEGGPVDFDYTYTLVEGNIVATHTPQEEPPHAYEP